MLYERLSRPEQVLFDLLALTLVLFYSRAAVIEPAATQYHRGIHIVFGDVPAFTPDGSPADITITFVLIAIGTSAMPGRRAGCGSIARAREENDDPSTSSSRSTGKRKNRSISKGTHPTKVPIVGRLARPLIANRRNDP